MSSTTGFTIRNRQVGDALPQKQCLFRVSVKHFRQSKQRWDPLDSERLVAPTVDVAGREIADMVAAAVQLLPPLQREVLILTQYEGLSLGETAASIEARVGTVKSRLHRARESLKRMLAPLREEAIRSSRPQ